LDSSTSDIQDEQIGVMIIFDMSKCKRVIMYD
jgi:hypothetical protein